MINSHMITVGRRWLLPVPEGSIWNLMDPVCILPVTLVFHGCIHGLPACAAPGGEMLSREDQSALLDLTWHWESAYAFSVVEAVWQAVPAIEPSAVLTADTAEELREKVRHDYASRQASMRPNRGERMST